MSQTANPVAIGAVEETFAHFFGVWVALNLVLQYQAWVFLDL
jgi:hypothetical protein